MATAPKPWLVDSAARARKKAAGVARRASWPPPRDSAEAGLQALQPFAGEEHRVLLFIRCATKGCGRNLAWVVDTDDGPVFWSVIQSQSPEHHDNEMRILRRMRVGNPGELERVIRNRRMLQAMGAKLGPLFPEAVRSARVRPLRRDVFDLLDAAGVHPDLETRCRKHGFATVERAALMQKLRIARKAPKPLTLWVHR